MSFISKEQGNKAKMYGVQAKKILGNREHKKTNFQFLANKGTSQFISRDHVTPPSAPCEGLDG